MYFFHCSRINSINAKKNTSAYIKSKHESVSKVFEDIKILTVHELYVYELIKFVCKSVNNLSTTAFSKNFYEIHSGQKCDRSSRLLTFTISSKRSTFHSFSLKHKGSKFVNFFIRKGVGPRKNWFIESRLGNGFCSNVPWSLDIFKQWSHKIWFWKVKMWLSWWLMLVDGCCDDCPGPKATNTFLPGTVRCGGWRLVDIIVDGCYAYSTQQKIVIFLEKGFFGHC